MQSDAAEITSSELLPIVPEFEAAVTPSNSLDVPLHRLAKTSRNPSTGSDFSNLRNATTAPSVLSVRPDQVPYNDAVGKQRQEEVHPYVNMPGSTQMLDIVPAPKNVPAADNLHASIYVDQPQQQHYYGKLNIVTPGPTSSQYGRLNHEQATYSHLESASASSVSPTKQGYAHIDRASSSQSLYVTPASELGLVPSSSYATPADLGLVQPNYATPIDLGPQANYAIPVDLGPQQEYTTPAPPIHRSAKPREIQLHSYVSVDNDWTA